MSSMPCESVLLHLCTPPPRDPICTLTPPVPGIGFPGLLHILDHQPCEACDACIPRICVRYGGGDGVHPEHKRGGAGGGGRFSVWGSGAGVAGGSSSKGVIPASGFSGNVDGTARRVS